jgi:Ca2+-binding EF-hand superfamily protein
VARILLSSVYLSEEEEIMVDGIAGVGSNTVSQIRQALFRKLDTNGDGVIDKTEMKAALQGGKKTSATGNQGASLRQVFGKLDTNNDGVISESEFDAALSKTQDAAGAYLAGTTSSLVNYLVTTNSQGGAAGAAAGQTGAVNNILKNYLAQAGQVARLQAAAQGFTAVV